MRLSEELFAFLQNYTGQPLNDEEREKFEYINRLRCLTLLEQPDGTPITDIQYTRKSVSQVLENFKSNYPEEEHWRLLVDGILYARAIPTDHLTATLGEQVEVLIGGADGWGKFEKREPGCTEAFLKTFYVYCLDENNLQRPLSSALIKDMHQAVTQNVKNIYVAKKPGFRTLSAHFSVQAPESKCFISTNIRINRFTQEGFLDLLIAIKNGHLSNAYLNCSDSFVKDNFPEDIQTEIDAALRPVISHVELAAIKKLLHNNNNIIDQAYLKRISKYENSFYCLAYLMLTLSATYYAPTKDIDKLVQKNINQYQINLTKARTSREVISVIATITQQFERIHPFADANGRVFVNILLNRLLIQNGFPPATFMDPNIFDAFEDISGGILRGIGNTLEMYASENKCLFGFNSQCHPISFLAQEEIAERKAILDKIQDEQLQNLTKNITQRHSAKLKILGLFAQYFTGQIRPLCADNDSHMPPKQYTLSKRTSNNSE